AKVTESGKARNAPQSFTTEGAPVARALDLRPWVTIRDQGNEASNPAIAVVTALETFVSLRGGTERFSPRYVYQKAKLLEEQAQEADQGVRIDTLVEVLQEFGSVPERVWPYEAKKYELPKNTTWDALDKQAEPYRARLIAVTATDEIPVHLRRGRP